MLAMLVVGVGLAWIGRQVHAARGRAAVVKRIQAEGGLIAYDYQGIVAYDMQGTAGQPKEPGTLSHWLGQDLAHDVISIGMSPYPPRAGTEDDPALAGLEHCNRLRAVGLSNRLANDDNLARLAGARELTQLYFVGDITDRGMRPLESLAELREIFVLAKETSLSTLPRAPNLEYLALINVHVDPRLMDQIGQYRQLKVLDLSNARLVDRELAPLGNLEQLEYLRLSENSIEGPGLEFLQRLPHLKSLDLQRTGIDDRLLPHILACPSLERLLIPVGSGHCSNEKLDALRRQRRQLKVNHDGERTMHCTLRRHRTVFELRSHPWDD